MSVPPLAFATVVSQDPDRYALVVSLHGTFGGQIPTISVKVTTHGPRDGVRGEYPELPTTGTQGIVVFPRGDIRNGHWIGATDPSLIDANPGAPGNGGQAYSARHGGGWFLRSAVGEEYTVFPDGSTIQIGLNIPAPTRHTLTETQARQRTEFTQAERVPEPPSAFPFAYNHPSGASVTVSAAGAVSVTVAPSQPLTMTVSGGGSVTINADGTINLQGSTVSVSNGGTTTPVMLEGGGSSTVLRA